MGPIPVAQPQEEQQENFAAGPIGVQEIGPKVPAATHTTTDDSSTVKYMVEKLVEAARKRGKAPLAKGEDSEELISGEHSAAKILAAQIATAAKRQKEEIESKRADRQKKRDEFFSTPAVAAAVEKKRHELSGQKDYKKE